MKRLGFLLAGAIALTASAHATELPVKAPPMAGTTPSVSGIVSLYGGGYYSTQPAEGQHDTVPLGGGDARLNWWFMPAASLQFDIEGEYASGIKECCNNDAKTRWYYTTVAHLAGRDPNTGALGLFGGLVWTHNLQDGNLSDYSMYGIEAQRYLGALTLYAQAGLLDLRKGEEDAKNIWFARGVSRYFSDPNTKFSLEFGYARGGMVGNTSNKITFLNWLLAAERKLPDKPVSFFVAYSGGQIKSSENPPDRAYDHTFMLGVRLYANQDSLLSNDRRGATFDNPGVLRYLSWAGEAD